MIKEISLERLFKAIVSKIWLVVVLALVCGAGANFYASHTITPMYTSTSMLYIYNNSNGNTSGRLDSASMMASQGALQLYLVVLKSQSVLESALDTVEEYQNKAFLGEEGYEEYEFLLDYKFSTGSIASMISAYQENETEILTVKARASDPRVAKFIAATVTEVLQYEVPQKIGATSNKLLQPATFSSSPSSPDVRSITLMGILIGAAVACAIIFLQLVLDTVIRTEDDLVEAFPNVPVLGVIPNIDGAVKSTARHSNKN